jgi:UDP-glucose:(heptosyl)LPS alpha-1,3-glucosyltransferase
MQYFGIRANVLRPGYGTDQGRQKSRSIRNPWERALRMTLRASPPLLWRRYQERWFYQPGQDEGPQVVAISDYMRREILESHGVDSHRIHLIHNGVDLAEFSPERRMELREEWRHHWDIPENAFCILSVGHNFRRKGVWEAMGHVKHLTDAGEDVCLLVAGRGTGKGQRKRAVSLARNHGIADRVRLAGIVHPSIRAFAASDVLLFPSWHDAFGFVILEAMACGIPVITTPFAGGSEVMEDGVSGFVVNPRDPEEARARLRELGEPDRRAAVGAEARAAAEGHGEESNFRRVEEVFRVAAEHGRAPVA